MIYFYIYLSLPLINSLIALPQHYYRYMTGDNDIRQNYDYNFSFLDWFVFEKGNSVFSGNIDTSEKIAIFLTLIILLSPLNLWFNVYPFLSRKLFTFPSISIPSLSSLFRYMHKRKHPEEYV